MRGPLSHLAKVVHRPDNAVAEMMLPDPVHHHTGSERVVGVRNRLGNFHAAAARYNRLLILTGDNLQEPAWHFLTKVLVVAADMDLHVVRFPIARQHGERRRRNVHRFALLSRKNRSLIGRRLFGIGEDNLVNDDVSFPAPVYNLEVAHAADGRSHSQRLPVWSVISVSSEMQSLVSVSDHGETEQPVLLQLCIAFGAADEDMYIQLR